MILFWIAALAILLYGMLMLIPATVFQLSVQRNKKVENENVFISVIVPVRNESESVAACLDSLLNQDYPQDRFEIILIDDHSTDETFSIAQKLAGQYPKIILLQNSETEQGKKAAVTKAISVAKGKLIAATDGDSIAGKRWLQAVAAAFSNPRIQFATGPLSYFRNKSFIRDFLQTELIAMQMLSGGTAALGFPVLANGANMAYRKDFFLRSGGYQQDGYVSGDDMMLLQKAREQDNAIAFISGKDALIHTASVPGFREAVLQRARWLSKTGTYRSPALLAASLILFSANLLPLITAGFFIADRSFLNALMIAAGGKALVDLLLLSLAVPFFREPRLLLLSPLGTVLYPALVIASTIRAFTGRIPWKGRDWKK